MWKIFGASARLHAVCAVFFYVLLHRHGKISRKIGKLKQILLEWVDFCCHFPISGQTKADSNTILL
ncbi:MAG: hypothetical protein UD299_00960 [Ruminococcus sp.]|nr:hypothetical protein [Ruminococcus sp.]